MKYQIHFLQSFQAPVIEIHYLRKKSEQAIIINTFEEAHALIRKVVNPNRIDHKEFFWVLLLSRSHRLLGIAEIAVGTLNCSVLDIREILQLALLTNASGIILCHNHPSGQLKASQQDITVTKSIIPLLKVLHIELLDHIIISSEGAYSMFQNNLF